MNANPLTYNGLIPGKLYRMSGNFCVYMYQGYKTGEQRPNGLYYPLSIFLFLEIAAQREGWLLNERATIFIKILQGETIGYLPVEYLYNGARQDWHEYGPRQEGAIGTKLFYPVDNLLELDPNEN